jgi:hypothetical protein
MRSLFVAAAVVGGSFAVNHFVLGDSITFGSFTMPGSRIGAASDAKVRTACYPAMEFPERERTRPMLPAGQHRIAPEDYDRTITLTAALNCYVVTQRNAVCDPHNRAYIVNYIGKYFSKQDVMLETARRYGDEEVRNVKILWNNDQSSAIAAALEDHIRSGRLNKSDFGWSVPVPLKAQLAEFSSTPDMCGKERPWTAAKM